MYTMYTIQECIPVECVSTTAVAISGGRAVSAIPASISHTPPSIPHPSLYYTTSIAHPFPLSHTPSIPPPLYTTSPLYTTPPSIPHPVYTTPLYTTPLLDTPSIPHHPIPKPPSILHPLLTDRSSRKLNLPRYHDVCCGIKTARIDTKPHRSVYLHRFNELPLAYSYDVITFAV